MKKILFTFITLGVLNSSFAQDAADKKVQAGIILGSGLNFTTPTTKLVSKDGVGTDLTIGMNLNLNFSPTVGLCTGVEFDFESFKYKSNSSTNLYYFYNDSEILNKSQYLDESGVSTLSTSAKLYQLTNRKVKPIYLTIPTMMLFRTKYIGYFRYFGKFGVRNSFLLKSSIFDEGNVIEGLTSTPLPNYNMMNSKRDLSIYKGAVGMSGGAEWNFSGTTCLVAEIGYYYGFVNINRSDAISGDSEKNMAVFSNSGAVLAPNIYTSIPAKQNQLMLKVSILF